MIGMLKLNKLLASEKHLEVLEADYGIDGRWFQSRTGEIDVLRPRFLAVLGQQKQNFKDMLKRVSSISGRRN
ncbi:hypothetical protein D9M70_481300 [compost metagenome]